MNMNGTHTLKLSPVALGLAFGIIKGVVILLLIWAAWLMNLHTMMGMPEVYAPTFLRGIVGGIMGFVVGFILGTLI